ncbi:Uncharacterised protein [Corynebacterium kutscheri]|uniref:Uncharacterized protein n=1 Tax=Corynebacterium kutscheri TaxID=35755 RepID=A0A0F6TE88_9CORY|nr:hypothetical protein [Corynebacterium kutscheri]AKE42269.1 hypothetical protein UL82_10675 [Corynebacterium kutscheri]VEH05640.1 Uncharacterised protein [Corynebacterium kutscheri]VEH10613.1 Uncharacterised protein [Corynebacterium kutscheri]VEH81534.1 Uncharacterised protein [Corynebacterium kutscheri]
MSRKQIILGFAIAQVMSLIGLWASGIFSDGASLAIMALAILGSIVIASVIWLVVYFFVYSARTQNKDSWNKKQKY